MRPSLFLCGVLAAIAPGCVTGQVVEARYPLHQDPVQLLAAVHTAGERMGWQEVPAPTADQPPSSTPTLAFSNSPSSSLRPLQVSASPDGTLVVQSTTQGNVDLLHPRADALAQATRQVLDPADVPRAAQPIQPRSPGLAVALTLLEPIAGGLYAHQGDPLTLPSSGLGVGTELAFNIIEELTDGWIVTLGALMARSDSLREDGFLLIGESSALLLATRIVGATRNFHDVQARNHLSASGFVFDLNDVVAPPEATSAP